MSSMTTNKFKTILVFGLLFFKLVRLLKYQKKIEIFRKYESS